MFRLFYIFEKKNYEKKFSDLLEDLEISLLNFSFVMIDRIYKMLVLLKTS